MTTDQTLGARALAEEFRDVDVRFGPVPIWWWSGARLERERLRWQMEQLVAGGISQAIIMCLAPRGPLYGSLADDPMFFSEEWWDLFLSACEDAAEIGFKFWLYDQFGFSGANFQGQLVAARPEWAGQELLRIARPVGDGETIRIEPPVGTVALAAYFVAAGERAVPVALEDDGAATWSQGVGVLSLCYAQTRGFDYNDRDACAALIDVVLGEFRRRADKWFGPVITGLFQDELPHMPTWGKDFASSFADSYGYDLVEHIASLWEGSEDDVEAASVRRDYQAHRAAVAREAFFVPYGAWAAEAGLTAGFDQQTPAREGDPVSATGLYGDYLRTHSVYSAPGSDHWGDPKVHSSLAHASGQPRTWIEAFHSSGWGGTLEETYDWLGPFLRRGANLYDPHAVYYATVGGWWEWAPPSTCWRQPYWPTYKVFSDAVTRLCRLTAGGALVADTVLLFPTTSVQADLPVAGPHEAARHTSDVYNQINGSTSWFDERPGVLDRARHDYEIFDEHALVNGEVDGSQWRVAGGLFGNLVLPSATTLDARFAEMLVRFATAGGNVVSVGPVPERVLGDDAATGKALREVTAAGAIKVVADAAEVPAALVRGPVWVESDVPFMLRRYGDTFVLLLVPHDEKTGTHMPVFAGNRVEDRMAGGFSWRAYWSSFAEHGYSFDAVGERRAHIRVHGAPAHAAQRWDPRSGDRVALGTTQQDDGSLALEVAFRDGPLAVVVLAPDLPGATRTDPSGTPQVLGDYDDGWELEACSTLDNRWGDFAGDADLGTLPIQVWRVDHTRSQDEADAPPAAGWAPTLATYGPYVRVAGPHDNCGEPGAHTTAWRAFDLSLSRGIRKDPIHFDSLGPKGTVPEEFLRWEGVGEGQWVGAAATVELPKGANRHLVVGSSAERRVFLQRSAVPVDGDGYWTSSPVPDAAQRLDLEIWLFRPARDADVGDVGEPADPLSELRATFALVADLKRFSRPEWVEPADGPRASSTVRFTTVVRLDEVPDAATVQVGSEGPCSLSVNGTEVGRQGAFEPYAAQRRPQVMPYDIGPALHPGDNTVTLQVDDLGPGVAVLVDSIAAADGGLGVVTDLSWRCTRDDVDAGIRMRRAQWLDPRWVALRCRPHPLPRASWLEPAAASGGVVLDLVPDAWSDGRRREWLRFLCPLGTTRLKVATELPFVAVVDGHEIAPRDGAVFFPAPVPFGTEVFLRFDVEGGHRGGGLLSGPLEVEVASAPAPLVDWEALGLRALGGHVTYRRRIEVDAVGADGALVLDLGEVRGSAEVRVNGSEATTLIWSPYCADVTALLRPGPNDIEVRVRGTLAGYLDDASPTPAVYKGQTRHGLFGPVRLLRYDSPETAP